MTRLALTLLLAVAHAAPAAKKTAVSPEAKKHFVKAVTFQKEAKAPADFELAIREYRAALELKPDWQEAQYNLALALESAGRFPEAEAELKKYIALKPKDAEKAETKLATLEAKAELAQREKSRQAEDAQAKQRARDRETEENILGVWRLVITYNGMPSLQKCSHYEAVREGSELALYDQDDSYVDRRNCYNAGGARSRFMTIGVRDGAMYGRLENRSQSLDRAQFTPDGFFELSINGNVMRLAREGKYPNR